MTNNPSPHKTLTTQQAILIVTSMVLICDSSKCDLELLLNAMRSADQKLFDTYVEAHDIFEWYQAGDFLQRSASLLENKDGQ